MLAPYLICFNIEGFFFFYKIGYFSNTLCQVGLLSLIFKAYAHCCNLFWRFFQCKMLWKWKTFVILWRWQHTACPSVRCPSVCLISHRLNICVLCCGNPAHLISEWDTVCIKCSLLPFWSHTAWRFSVKGLTVLPLLFLLHLFVFPHIYWEPSFSILCIYLKHPLEK